MEEVVVFDESVDLVGVLMGRVVVVVINCVGLFWRWVCWMRVGSSVGD